MSQILERKIIEYINNKKIYKKYTPLIQLKQLFPKSSDLYAAKDDDPLNLTYFVNTDVEGAKLFYFYNQFGTLQPIPYPENFTSEAEGLAEFVVLAFNGTEYDYVIIPIHLSFKVKNIYINNIVTNQEHIGIKPETLILNYKSLSAQLETFVLQRFNGEEYEDIKPDINFKVGETYTLLLRYKFKESTENTRFFSLNTSLSAETIRLTSIDNSMFILYNNENNSLSFFNRGVFKEYEENPTNFIINFFTFNVKNREVLLYYQNIVEATSRKVSIQFSENNQIFFFEITIYLYQNSHEFFSNNLLNVNVFKLSAVIKKEAGDSDIVEPYIVNFFNEDMDRIENVWKNEIMVNSINDGYIAYQTAYVLPEGRSLHYQVFTQNGKYFDNIEFSVSSNGSYWISKKISDVFSTVPGSVYNIVSHFNNLTEFLLDLKVVSEVKEDTIGDLIFRFYFGGIEFFNPVIENRFKLELATFVNKFFEFHIYDWKKSYTNLHEVKFGDIAKTPLKEYESDSFDIYLKFRTE